MLIFLPLNSILLEKNTFFNLQWKLKQKPFYFLFIIMFKLLIRTINKYVYQRLNLMKIKIYSISLI